MTRSFDAAVARVFAAWTSPERIMRWWGPKDFTAEVFEMDFRPGGAWRSVIRAATGERRYGSSGRYLEIVENRLRRFTFAWDSDGAKDTEVTVSFVEADGRTTMSFHQAQFGTQASRDSHQIGWEECLDHLVAALGSRVAP